MLLMATSAAVSNVPEFITVGQAVSRLSGRGVSVTRQTVRRWVKAGKVRAIRSPGGRFHVRTDDLDALFAQPVAA